MPSSSCRDTWRKHRLIMKSARPASIAILLLMLGLAWLPLRAVVQLPLGSLVVTIPSPASGFTVAGTIPVRASVGITGALVVEGVQFKLDGANLGAEDTNAPYSISWDTTTASNGSHTLVAVARDQLGFEYPSAPAAGRVSNAAPAPPPPPTARRFEETDPSVSYSAGWSPDSSRSWSGGTAAVSATAGAQASFSFSGPSVRWIGGRGSATGVARVFVDGVLVGEVDTYSRTEEIRVPMFTVNGLTDASHTLTIQLTGQMNPQATSALIVVDAFDVPAPAVSRLQETDPDIAYTPGWVQGEASRPWSAGAAALSTTPGAQATLTFTGTGISWIGARGPQTGIARVFLDGALMQDIDPYPLTEGPQPTAFTATGLTAGTHTLTIQVLGKNPASTDFWILVDAFNVMP